MTTRLQRGDYACLLCNLYRYAVPKLCQHSQTSRAESPLDPLLCMVQHVDYWVAPFLCRQHFPSPPLKFLHTPALSSSSPFLPYVHES